MHTENKENQDDKEYQMVKLIAKKWRSLLSENSYKLIIVEALNYCVHNGDLHLRGYLITSDSVYIIARQSEDEINCVLDEFYKQVMHKLHKYFKNTNIPVVGLVQEKNLVFLRVTFNPGMLSRLLLGHQVNLPYFSPKLEFLKDKINNYRYCSTNSYQGALGLVKLSG